MKYTKSLKTAADRARDLLASVGRDVPDKPSAELLAHALDALTTPKTYQGEGMTTPEVCDLIRYRPVGAVPDRYPAHIAWALSILAGRSEGLRSRR